MQPFIFISGKPTNDFFDIATHVDDEKMFATNTLESFNPFTGKKMESISQDLSKAPTSRFNNSMVRVGFCDGVPQYAHHRDVDFIIKNNIRKLYAVDTGKQYDVKISTADVLGLEPEETEMNELEAENENEATHDVAIADVTEDFMTEIELDGEDELNKDIKEEFEVEDSPGIEEEAILDSDEEDVTDSDLDDMEMKDNPADDIDEMFEDDLDDVPEADELSDGETEDELMDEDDDFEVDESAIAETLKMLENEEDVDNTEMEMVSAPESEGVDISFDHRFRNELAQIDCVMDPNKTKYYVYANGYPVGFLDRASAGRENAAMFDSPAFVKGFTHQFKQNRDVSLFGYKRYGVKVDISKIKDRIINEHNESLKTDQANHLNSEIEKLKRCLDIAAVASIKGFTDNPLKSRLIQAMDRNGIEGSEPIISRVLEDHAASYLAHLLDEAKKLAKKSDEVINEYSLLVNRSNFVGNLAKGGQVVQENDVAKTKSEKPANFWQKVIR